MDKSINITIDGKSVPMEEVEQWRYGRISNAFHNLKMHEHVPSEPAKAEAKLLKVKLSLGENEIQRRMEAILRLNTAAIKIFTRLSHGKRKFAVAKITADGITSEQAAYWINTVNLNAEHNEEYTKVNLAANPDHYVLRCTQDHTLEVIECNGNYKTPFQFFITYGDETGLRTPVNPNYPYQSVGAARTAEGTVIGGVRHQFRDTATGFEALLCVEFPSATPSFVVKSHQIHLAAEFSYWLNWAIRKVQEQEY